MILIGIGGIHTNKIFEKIKICGIVADIQPEEPEKAVLLAQAIQAGGLSVCVTTQTNAVEKIRRATNGMLIGIICATDCAQIDKAAAAGADFIITSGFDQALAEYCTANNIPLIPGAENMEDMMQISKAGIEVAAVFPQRKKVSQELIREAGKCFPMLRFILMEIGQEEQLNEYLLLPGVIACTYTRIGAAELTEESSLVAEYTKSAINRMLGFEIGHVGINFDDDMEAKKTAAYLSGIFGLPLYEGKPSYFAGTIFECVKAPYWGHNGHVAIRTNHIERAVEYLCARGIKFNEASRQYDDCGRMRTIYFADDIADFVMHLLQK